MLFKNPIILILPVAIAFSEPGISQIETVFLPLLPVRGALPEPEEEGTWPVTVTNLHKNHVTTLFFLGKISNSNGRAFWFRSSR
ncbi:hypothetical protein [Endozoicomonas sp. 4G]|uniref:hypothetical protein n=1 Tax=Endozoicomonas sp. 4G TaxID=2872754 RepID=UPI002078F173|nr:hypothetical protein [Endozoicomonas sp. 4G]